MCNFNLFQNVVYKCDVTNQWDADVTGNVPSMVWYHIYGVVASSCIYGVIAKRIGTKTKWMNSDGYFFSESLFVVLALYHYPEPPEIALRQYQAD